MFGYITLFSALSLAATAAWFAIAGIMVLFGGNPIPVLIMGAGIELAKVVGVSWLYRNWKEVGWRLKYPGAFLVFIAMLLTSMGIFGFLSKAHIEQSADIGNNSLQIERLDQRIARQQAVIDREQDKINSADSVIQQLDETVQVLIDNSIISDPNRGARVVRERQQPQRDALAAEVTAAQNNIDSAEDVIADLQDERLDLSQAVRELELEVGPVKYIAEIIYDDPENSLEDAVRIVIIMFIFVFDPMAIWLLMAANYTLMRHQHFFEEDEEDDPEPESPTRKIIPNAEVEFKPSEPAKPKEFTDAECERLKEEREEMERQKADKAKSVEIPAEPIEEEKEKGPRKHTTTRPHKFGG